VATQTRRGFEEATVEFERAAEILTGGDLAHCLANYADMNFQQGKPVTAVDLYRKAIDAAQRSFGAQHPKTAMLMARLADVRRGQGLYAESVKLYRRALPILEASPEAGGDYLRTVRAKYDATLKESAKTMLVR
jgi:tetratricopeptide (TPR) repeat protein